MLSREAVKYGLKLCPPRSRPYLAAGKAMGHNRLPNLHSQVENFIKKTFTDSGERFFNFLS